jgi:hypothetical protein
MEEISRYAADLHHLANEAINEISEFTTNIRNLARRNIRSPRATKILKNLEAIISTVVPSKLTAEYGISTYTTGYQCWK